jgi:hypothetical protein
MKVGEVITFRGACDASGGLSLGTNLLVIANDEDNVLRYYDLGTPAAMPVEEDWSERLEVEGDPGENETDIESATTLGELSFWIGSHSRSKKAKKRPDRHRIFATRWVTTGPAPHLALVGKPYRNLLADLVADDRFNDFDLLAASNLAPKQPSGFNIESLCATKHGGLLIGFRNPVPAGKALLIPLLNGPDIIEGSAPRFGNAVQLDLGGLGVRDMVRWEDGYLLIGGPIGDPAAGAVESRLFRWSGSSAKPELLDLPFTGFNPEGLIEVGSPPATRLLVLSDDGALSPTRTACKELSPHDPAKRFRALWLS